MSKKIRQLITLLVVVVLIGAMVGVMALFPAAPDGDTDSSSSNTSSEDPDAVYLYEHKDIEVDSVTLKNEAGTFEVDVTYNEETEKAEYTLLGYEGTNNLVTMPPKIAAFAQKLEVIREMGAKENLAEFGLTEETATARFTAYYTDGTKEDILIGGTLNSNEEQRYAVKVGSNEVFVTEVDQLIEITPLKLLPTLLMSIQAMQDDDSLVAPEFKSIRFSGRGHDKPVIIRRTDELELDESSPLYSSVYYVDQNPVLPVLPEATSTYLMDMCLIQGKDVAAVKPTKAQLTQYGFDDPLYMDVEVIATVGAGEITDRIDEYHLLIGNINEKEGIAYAMLKDRDVIYVIDSDCVKAATMSAFEMRDTLMYLISVNSVAKMEVEAGGKSYTFIRDRIEKEITDSSSGETTVQYEYETYYNNEKMAKFGTFFTQFLATYAEAEATGNEVKGELLFKTTLTHYDEMDKGTTEVCVYACDDDRRVLYEVDGELLGLAKKSWATKLISDVERLVKGENITLTM